jgi:thiol-disulfide isomerase/thioredoxin
MYKYLTLFLLGTVLFSCTNEPAQKKTGKLSGNIEGLSNNNLLLISKAGTDTVKIDSIGHFYFEKEYIEPTYYKVYLGRDNISLYLTNNSDLSFSTSKNNFSKDLIFKGKGSKENTLLNQKLSMVENKKYVYSLFPLEPEAFLAKSDSTKQILQNLVNTYAKSSDIDSTFLTTFNIDIKYGQISNWSLYTVYHKYLTKEDAALPKQTEQIIESAVVDNDEYSNSVKYISFMREQLHKEYKDIKSTNDTDEENYDIPKYLRWLDGRLNSNKIKNSIFYDAVKYDITYSSETERDNIYATFSELNTDATYQKAIDDIYASFEKLRKGKPAPQWAYPDINGKEYALKDFKGKNVYVDVWATWCGPCKAEIPELAKLAKDYKNKDIVFVSVSVDDNKGAWEKMLKANNYEWIQIHAEKAWKSKIIKENGIRGIPRFMMIDKEGNIVDVNAPQPSSDKIRPLIDSLLNQK